MIDVGGLAPVEYMHWYDWLILLGIILIGAAVLAFVDWRDDRNIIKSPPPALPRHTPTVPADGGLPRPVAACGSTKDAA
jgi:hypothetical protein